MFAPDESDPLRGDVTSLALSRAERLVVSRMVETKATVPEFTASIDILTEPMMALRAKLKADSDDDNPLPSYNDIVIKACALALREHPRVNGSYVEGRLELYGRINVGFVVTTARALYVPTVLDAERADRSRRGAEVLGGYRARDGNTDRARTARFDDAARVEGCHLHCVESGNVWDRPLHGDCQRAECWDSRGGRYSREGCTHLDL